jgi:hypothetical protein
MKISNKLSETIIDQVRFDEALNTLMNDIENVSSSRAISIIRANFKDEVNDTVESLTVFSNEAKFKSFIEDARQSYLNQQFTSCPNVNGNVSIGFMTICMILASVR